MATTQQTVFGPGVLFVKTSATGSAYKQLGSIQEFTFDESKTSKELYGSYQFPIDVATSTIKLSGKMKQAVVNAQNYNDIFFGQTAVTGQTLTAVGEYATIPASPYTVTVSQSTKFVMDLGVSYADGSGALTYISTGTPTVGQYSVNTTTGVYTFAAADTLVSVSISYRYTSTTGVKITNSQQLIGQTVTFSLLYVSQHSGKEISLEFFRVIAPKLAMNFKHEDFMIPELDLAMFANDAGNAFILNTAA